jgi:hypothetical protein
MSISTFNLTGTIIFDKLNLRNSMKEGLENAEST